MKRMPLVAAISTFFLPVLSVLADPIGMGPQSMEGNLKVNPGALLRAGFDFTIPGSHPAIDVQIVNPMVTFQAQCVSGGGGGTIVLPLYDSLITVPQNSSAWYPSGDQHSPAVYQGSIVVPDLCGGEPLTLKSGGTFTADLQASDTSRSVHLRWHYSANGSAGGWSGTKSIVPN